MTSCANPWSADADWSVRREGWDPGRITHHGNLFLLGNGYMGYRGTLEEFGPEEKVGLLVPGLYDRVDGAWREPVNAPNGLLTRVFLDGQALNPLCVAPHRHLQALDLYGACHYRETEFAAGGARVRIEAERFLSADRIHLMVLRHVVRVEGEGTLAIETGIDERVWDLNGPHLEDLTFSEDGGVLVLQARTHEAGHRLAVAQAALLSRDGVVTEPGIVAGRRRWEFHVRGSSTVELHVFAATFSSRDVAGDPAAAALRHAREAAAAGHASLREAHRGVWADRWRRADVLIAGDARAQHALRYSLYQLLAAAPFHSEHLSIPARALSGQVYKGAIFWDTEIFMFPFFLAVFPEVARNLVRYRVHTLPGARAKAREYGFAGAFYPWEGQEGGYEACTLFNITDVFTNRPMRTYFRDKQIHISGDVAWAVWQYYLATGDRELLWDGGWEVMLECARFFLSRAHRTFDDRAFVLTDVTGPDEYHERVANNAYTNHLAQYTTKAALEAAALLRRADGPRFTALAAQLRFDDGEAARLEDFATRLHLPLPDPLTGVVEQFDDYLQLEDCSLEALKGRIIHPNEYLGGGNGLATTTRIIKQADVVLLSHLLGECFTTGQKRANWEFYEPRTEHGSSLSACAYALVAAETGRLDFAYTYFLRTAMIDLEGKSKQHVGTLYIGGTHPAANGGAWMVAVQGFGGARLLPDRVALRPALPSGWQSLQFGLCWRGRRLVVTIRRDTVHLAADPANDGPVPCSAGCQTVVCLPGQSCVLEGDGVQQA